MDENKTYPPIRDKFIFIAMGVYFIAVGILTYMMFTDKEAIYSTSNSEFPVIVDAILYFILCISLSVIILALPISLLFGTIYLFTISDYVNSFQEDYRNALKIPYNVMCAIRDDNGPEWENNWKLGNVYWRESQKCYIDSDEFHIYYKHTVVDIGFINYLKEQRKYNKEKKKSDIEFKNACVNKLDAEALKKQQELIKNLKSDLDNIEVRNRTKAQKALNLFKEINEEIKGE